MKIKRICPGVYEAFLNVEITEDGRTRTVPAVATIQREEVWGRNCWALDLVAKEGDREISLTCHDEVYYAKSDVIDSLRGTLLHWQKGDLGWTI